jgi:hypothetical protein
MSIIFESSIILRKQMAFFAFRNSRNIHTNLSSLYQQSLPPQQFNIRKIFFKTLGAFPARSAGNRAFRSNLLYRESGTKVFPLQSLARLQTGAFFRRTRRYFLVRLNCCRRLMIYLH